MDISSQTEILLRDAAYDTWSWSGVQAPVIGFENEAIAGFVYFFPAGDLLLKNWFEMQRLVLDRHALALRSAGAKAWNIYSIFLADIATSEEQRAIERIDEDFTLTRKIARANIPSVDDLRTALLPLLPIQSRTGFGTAHYEELLRARLKDIAPAVVDAFIGPAAASDVVHMLETGK